MILLIKGRVLPLNGLTKQSVNPDAPYFIILLCLMPDDFTHQGESAATQWVNQTICQCILLTL